MNQYREAELSEQLKQIDEKPEARAALLNYVKKQIGYRFRLEQHAADLEAVVREILREVPRATVCARIRQILDRKEV